MCKENLPFYLLLSNDASVQEDLRTVNHAKLYKTNSNLFQLININIHELVIVIIIIIIIIIITAIIITIIIIQ